MKKPSLSFELEGLLRKKNCWCHPAELEDFGRSLGFLSSNVTRRLRDLRKAGKVVSEPREHGVTWWRATHIGTPVKMEQLKQLYLQIQPYKL